MSEDPGWFRGHNTNFLIETTGVGKFLVGGIRLPDTPYGKIKKK